MSLFNLKFCWNTKNNVKNYKIFDFIKLNKLGLILSHITKPCGSLYRPIQPVNCQKSSSEQVCWN